MCILHHYRRSIYSSTSSRHLFRLTSPLAPSLQTQPPIQYHIMSVAIFPASGGLGGATLSHLLDTVRVDPSSLTLIARSPERLAKEEGRGAKVLKADYDHPETLDGVFAGVEVLNLISYASFQHKYRFKVCHSKRYSVARADVRLQKRLSTLQFHKEFVISFTLPSHSLGMAKSPTNHM